MLTVLIADDTNTDRLILQSLVRQLGYNTLAAHNGKEAVALYQANRPDIVLMDVVMPEMDGYDAARAIKRLAGEVFVPILFLTSLTDADSLVACLDAGGDDFIPKPYHKPILQAKMTAFGRIHELQTTLIEQRDQLRKHHKSLLKEQNIARHVFDNIAGRGCLDNDNIRYMMSSFAIFNGDVLVAAPRPNGNLMLMLGDFTGHGLPAALGSMPLATTFYGMVGKGFSQKDILREINAKLKQLLPSGIFCCALFVEVDYLQQQLKVWNGGLPPAFLYRAHSSAIEPIKSMSLPLGIVSNQKLNDQCRVFDIVQPSDRLFLWTDGIHEARRTDGEMFGEPRLRQVFEESDPAHPEAIFDRVLDAIHTHVGGESPDDDLSLVEILLKPEVGGILNTVPSATQSGLIDWSLTLTIRPPTFQHFDPLPLLMNLFSDVPGLRSRSSDIYTVLSELYTNAVDHGLLRLGRSLRPGPESGGDYELLRKERLSCLTDGSVQFTFEHVNQDGKGRLTITVKDSGKGFDHHRLTHVAMQQNAAYSGRGIEKVYRLCDSLDFLGAGNEVMVRLSWDSDG